nr:MAG TPA: hypothetical protein [Caudoviricetes sp.]
MSFPAKLNAEADFLRPSPIAAESVANSFPSLFNESTMVMLSVAVILNLLYCIRFAISYMLLIIFL